jgi:ribosome-associated heat shock protein Hsp15
MADDSNTSVRIDKWLWAARAFRSRTLAAQACSGGKISVNAAQASAHKPTRVGDIVAISTARGTQRWRVLALAERRGPAALARTLYEDLTPPPAVAPAEPYAIPLPPRRERGSGRPTKRERRTIDRLRLR